MKIETLNNAPITEAVFDIRTLTDRPISIDKLNEIHSKVKDELPIKEEISVLEAYFGVGPEGLKTSYEQQKPGFMFKSSDRKNIFQAKVGGFTFNRLSPYVNWKSFSGDADNYWKIYSDIVKPTKVTRLALRYINKIELPYSTRNLDQYFNIGPDFSGKSSHKIQGFILRMNIVQPKNSFEAIVTMIKETDIEKKRKLVIILDIDTFQLADLSPNNPKVKTAFNHLRKYKNELFFNNITAKTKALFS